MMDGWSEARVGPWPGPARTARVLAGGALLMVPVVLLLSCQRTEVQPAHANAVPIDSHYLTWG